MQHEKKHYFQEEKKEKKTKIIFILLHVRSTHHCAVDWRHCCRRCFRQHAKSIRIRRQFIAMLSLARSKFHSILLFLLIRSVHCRTACASERHDARVQREEGRQAAPGSRGEALVCGELDQGARRVDRGLVAKQTGVA